MPFRKTPNSDGRIRVGVGGWTFEPWRRVFYPADLPKTRELEYASRKLTSIEINGTVQGNKLSDDATLRTRRIFPTFSRPSLSKLHTN